MSGGHGDGGAGAARDQVTLAGLFPAVPLPGCATVPDGELGTGPLDLDRAARAEVDPDAERALLTTRGFEVGHARAWRRGADEVVHMTVLRFADATGARGYLLDGADALAARGVELHDVAGLDAPGVAFADVDRAGGAEFRVRGVAFVVRRLHGLVLVGGEAPAGDAATDAARALRCRLPAP